MDKLREEFEVWANNRYSWYIHEDARDEEDKTLSTWNGEFYLNRIVNGMFEAWKASRECLVITLPEIHRETTWDDEGISLMWPDEVETAIHAAGVPTK